MPDVFISYSTKDTAQAEEILRVLEQNGISCWMAPRNIPGGSNYTEEIPKAIRGCKAFVLVLSPHSNASHWVFKELDTAASACKILLPMMLADFPISDSFDFLLRGKQRYFAYENKAKAMGLLVERLQQIIQGVVPPETPYGIWPESGQDGLSFDALKKLPPEKLNEAIRTLRKKLEWDPKSRALNAAIGFCYLRLKLYDKAIPCFEQAVEDDFENAEACYYLAVALLRGKRPFLATKAAIQKIEQYIQAALMIEPKGLYHYFWAYIRYDHHFRKLYRMNPDYRELLTRAKQAGVSPEEIAQMYTLLEVSRPDVM